MSLTKYVASALGRSSFRDAWKAGGWKVLIDGNLAETLIEHGPGGELVGVDYNGNKYFEKKDAQWVRNRWVVYAKSNHYSTQDSSTVPPEWHPWLHYISDDNPTNSEWKKQVYAVDAEAHPSLTVGGAIHQPKGAWSNPQKLTWRKYEAWRP